MTGRIVLVVLLSYLLGSIPFTYVTGRIWRGVDLSQRGSGNLGGTNAIRVLGPVPGILAGLADVGKAALAVYLAGRFTGTGWAPAFAAMALSLGHNFSLYLGLAKGGKGVSPIIGSFLVLAPLPTMIGLAVALVLVLLTRLVSLGALVFVTLLPVALFASGSPAPPVTAALLMGVLSIVRHRENIKRLKSGTERRFGERA